MDQAPINNDSLTKRFVELKEKIDNGIPFTRFDLIEIESTFKQSPDYLSECETFICDLVTQKDADVPFCIEIIHGLRVPVISSFIRNLLVFRIPFGDLNGMHCLYYAFGTELTPEDRVDLYHRCKAFNQPKILEWLKLQSPYQTRSVNERRLKAAELVNQFYRQV